MGCWMPSAPRRLFQGLAGKLGTLAGADVGKEISISIDTHGHGYLECISPFLARQYGVALCPISTYTLPTVGSDYTCPFSRS